MTLAEGDTSSDCRANTNDFDGARRAYFDAVGGFFVEDGYVAPAQSADDFNHGLDLMQIRRDGPREEFKSLFVTQLRRR